MISRSSVARGSNQAVEVNQIIDGESVRPCDNCWPDKELINMQEAGAMGTGVNSRLQKRQDSKNAIGRLTTKVNKAWSAAITAQVVQLGGVPITKEEIRKQVLADEDEDEAGPSNKTQKKKGGQQKITFLHPKVTKAVTHPVGTGTLGLLFGMLFMVGLGAKKM